MRAGLAWFVFCAAALSGCATPIPRPADLVLLNGKVITVDERFSTARALQAVREAGGTVRGRKTDLDALAASVLLQHYLDAQRGTAT